MAPRKMRYLLFYGLIAAFFIVMPVIIAVALGYSFDLDDIKFKKTGGIFVKSNSVNISVSLDNNFVKGTSFFSRGALISEIDPGTHIIRLEKKGYRPWFKTVEVEESYVTELRNILLVPNQVEIATSTQAEISIINATSSPSGAFFIDDLGNLITKENFEIPVAANVHSFAYIKNTLYMVDKNGFLSELNQDEKISIIGRPGFYLTENGQLRFSEAPSGDIGILDQSGGLFLLNRDKKLTIISGGIKNFSFDSKGSKLLLLKEDRIEIIWLEDNKYQPFQKAGIKEDILGLGENILDADWFYGDDSHILIHTNQGIYITEVDGRGGRNTLELLSNPNVEELITAPKLPSEIFFRIGRSIQKIEL